MLNERELEIADEWVRNNVLDDEECDFDDCEEDGSTVKYFFYRHTDHASVVYLVTVKAGSLFSIKKEVYHEEGQGDRPDEEEWILRGKGSRRGKSSAGGRGSRSGKRSRRG